MKFSRIEVEIATSDDVEVRGRSLVLQPKDGGPSLTLTFPDRTAVPDLLDISKAMNVALGNAEAIEREGRD